MKLAEALILRADCQKRLHEIKQRLIRSAKVQEGEEPPEQPQALLEELNNLINQLADLIQKINRTNSSTMLEDNLSISDALAQRDSLQLKKSVYDTVIQTAATRQDRYGRSEIKYISTVNIAELQTQSDRMARDYRQLDTRIQQANWNTELLE
ncbi:MAG: DIP1984 family protein [Pleurocapsa sp. MO_226.B13]|nr:DIP1984 family protein [Pleurocapsa sp. MO_226.B13]